MSSEEQGGLGGTHQAAAELADAIAARIDGYALTTPLLPRDGSTS
jgi:hypothetical protein